MERKALFFLRSYNDIDHMVPVMYKLATTTNIKIVIILMRSKKYNKDYRLKFLIKNEEVSILHINDFNLIKKLKNIKVKKNLLQIILTFLRNIDCKSILMKGLGYFNTSSKIKYQKIFVENLINYIFGDSEKGIVVFDWKESIKDKIKFANLVIETAKRKGIPNISLPHGDSPDFNKMFKMDTINYESIYKWEDNPFDIVVVPNIQCAKRYIQCKRKDKDKIKILGSPRFNEEWLNVLDEIVPKYENPNAKGKLKIVFFLRHPNYPVFWEEVIRSIQLITQFSEVYLIVKHHTRSVYIEKLIKKHPELSKGNINNLEFVYENIHSNALIKWADVFLDLGTSIIFEAIRKGKPLLAMDYLQANISTSGHYLKSTVMHCRDELYDEIKTLIRNPKHRLYSEKERQTFVEEMIDFPDGNVLERYVGIIEQLIESASNAKKGSI